VIPVGAVLGSAIEDALGVPITEMPLSPLKLFELSQAGGLDPNARINA
jgi:aerobic carbon-monoxide dehydrogenase large subunit